MATKRLIDEFKTLKPEESVSLVILFLPLLVAMFALIAPWAITYPVLLVAGTSYGMLCTSHLLLGKSVTGTLITTTQMAVAMTFFMVVSSFAA